MKFQVKVGQEFPCYVVEEQSIPLVLQVTQTVSLPSIEGRASPPKELSRFANKPMWGVVLALGVGLFPPILYGWATGDYSALKLLADSGRDLLFASFKLLGKS